jgi:prepilin-type N-terminal cleavage/methylation domain-containing protein
MMNKKRIHTTNINCNKQAGFTIVELMVATVIFSLLLVGSMAAFIQMGQLYYKGITVSRLQDTNRAIIAEIAQEIQFTKATIRTPTFDPAGIRISAGATSDGYFCVGPKRYTYALDRQLKSDSPQVSQKQRRHVLWVDTPSGACNSAANLDTATPSVTGREMLGENMRLVNLKLEEVLSGGASTGLWRIQVDVAYGDEELLEERAGRYQCKGNIANSQFCAISELSTTIVRRIP